jgi:hypothetical protein
MLRKLRPRLTYANVTATLALFLALGGGAAYAANEWNSSNIQDNTLESRDLKDNAGVKSADVVDDTATGGGLRSRDIFNDGLTSRDVKGLTGADVTDDSLTGHDVDEETLETVPSARELGTRDSGDFPTRVGSGQFGTAELQWTAEFMDTNAAADHDFPFVELRTTGTAGQFKVCAASGATDFTIYVNGTRTTHSTTSGTDNCASTTFDPGNRGDFEILARRARIVGWDGDSGTAEDYTTYSLVGPFS